jgi:hypothetical protein
MKQKNHKNFYFAGNVIKSVFLIIIIICDMSSYSTSSLLSNNVRKFSCTGSCVDSGCIKWAYNLRIDQSLPVESALKLPHSILKNGRSHWPRSLKRGSAAACLLEFWFQICPGSWMSVYCECCVLSVEVSASGWPLIQGSPAECVHACNIECDCEALIMRRPWPARGCYAMGEKNVEKWLNYCYRLAHTFLCVPSHWMDC